MAPNGVHHDPWVGRTFGGRFRLVAPIARGSMGAVYLARDPHGTEVAIKILELHAETPDRQARAEARFLRESSTLSRLTHPHTVRVYGVGTDLGYPWIAMEYIRGRSLRDLIAERPIDPVRGIRIVRQICGSVAEAHAHGIIHRDLKPANVLVGTDGRGGDYAKVVDFGLVKQLEGDQHLTAQGLLVGTPMYMSPEQIRGEPDIDQRSDLYGLGVMLYQILTGRLPFPHEGTAAVLLAHLSEAPAPFPSDLDLPSCAELLVRRTLHKDRNRRIQTVAHFDELLGMVEAVLLGQVSDAWAVAHIQPPRSASRHGAADGAGATVGMAALWIAVFGVVVAIGTTFAAVGSFVAIQLLLRL